MNIIALIVLPNALALSRFAFPFCFIVKLLLGSSLLLFSSLFSLSNPVELNCTQKADTQGNWYRLPFNFCVSQSSSQPRSKRTSLVLVLYGARAETGARSYARGAQIVGRMTEASSFQSEARTQHCRSLRFGKCRYERHE